MNEMIQPLRRKENAYFAASNSCRGFHSYYEQCFRGRVDTMYIIKGGPGTGKSRLMRDMVHAGEAHGYRAELFYCSSDPDSLDGVLLYGPDGSSLGFLDGTAPHTFEPSFPGVKEELLDLGVFWSHERLSAKQAQIAALMEEKNARYQQAYRYLAAAGACADNIHALVQPCVEESRLARMAKRLMAGVAPMSEEHKSIQIRLMDSIGMKGRVLLPTFVQQAQRVCYLEDYYDAGYLLTDAIVTLGRSRGLEMQISYHPVYLDRVDAVLFPQSETVFVACDGTGRELQAADDAHFRTVGLRRLLHVQKLREVRDEVRFAQRERENLVEAASRSLAAAAKAHFAIEQMYIAAMDFSAKEQFTTELVQRLFSD